MTFEKLLKKLANSLEKLNINYKKGNSTRHLEDIQSIIKISKNKIDLKYLKKEAEKQGAFNILNSLLSQ